MDVSILVATYGDKEWLLEGNDTSKLLSENFPDIPVIRVHSARGSLSDVRNSAAAMVDTEWLCFVDAGDSLDAKYFTTMSKAVGDLRTPRLALVNPDTNEVQMPFDLTKRNMDFGNPCPIGTLIRYEMFEDIGGFWDEPAYEDWSLFRRAWLLGATIEHTDAVYYAVDEPNSRNKQVTSPVNLIKSIRNSHTEWMDNIA